MGIHSQPADDRVLNGQNEDGLPQTGQTGEQDGHECNQPKLPICKCGKMKRMCLGSNADKHGGEGRREQRRERLQCSMREWFKLLTEQRVAAEPESAEAKSPAKRRWHNAWAYRMAFRA